MATRSTTGKRTASAAASELDAMLLRTLRQARKGNNDAARDLYSELAGLLLCRDGHDLTAFARKVLAKRLLLLARGEPAEETLMLKRPSGQPRWVKLRQEINIYGDMLSLIEPGGDHPGMSASAAAREIEASGAYPGVGVKRMQNIYSNFHNADPDELARELFPE